MYQVMTCPNMIATIKEVSSIHQTESPEIIQSVNDIINKLKDFNESL